jgi:hypothetical protein
MKLTLLNIFVFSILSSFGQTNLIQNGSFENGTRLSQDFYTSLSSIHNNSQPLNGCDFWSVATPDPDACGPLGGGGCFTADWYDPAIPIPIDAGPYAPPPLNNTNKCAGMILTNANSNDPFFEGVRQTLMHKLVGGRFYKIKLRIAIGNYNGNTSTNKSNISKDCGVVIGFSKFSKHYNASPSTTANVAWREAIKFSIPANSPHEWYEFTEYFRVPYFVNGGGAVELENIIITTDKEKGDKSVVFLDDVELIEFDPCNNPCKDERLDYSPEIYTGGNPKNYTLNGGHNGVSGQPFNFKTENAFEINLTILNRWGVIIYDKTEYDPNVLTDRYSLGLPTASDVFYITYWNGLDFDNQKVTVSEAYTYIVSAKNCHSTKTVSGTVTVVSHLSEHNTQILTTNVAVNRIKPCCEGQLTLKNINYFQGQLDKAIFSITAAGDQSTINIFSSDLVKFTAGNYVELLDGFETHDSSNFEAICAPCSEVTLQKSKQNNSIPFNRLIMGENENNNQINHENVNLFPNPTENSIIFKISEISADAQIKYKVYNMFGKLIFEGQNSNNGELNLSGCSDGIYFAEFKFNENLWYGKFIKK